MQNTEHTQQIKSTRVSHLPCALCFLFLCVTLVATPSSAMALVQWSANLMENGKLGWVRDQKDRSEKLEIIGQGSGEKAWVRWMKGVCRYKRGGNSRVNIFSISCCTFCTTECYTGQKARPRYIFASQCRSFFNIYHGWMRYPVFCDQLFKKKGFHTERHRHKNTIDWDCCRKEIQENKWKRPRSTKSIYRQSTLKKMKIGKRGRPLLNMKTMQGFPSYNNNSLCCCNAIKKDLL